MTEPIPDSHPAPPVARRDNRFIIGVLLVCTALFVAYYLRGTWAVAEPSDPQTPDEGVICQLVRRAEGGTEIRTAAVIPVPLETAWQILSDYEEWEKLFKTVRRKQVTEQIAENKHHVVSDVLTPLGTLKLDFVVTHEEIPDGGYLAWWDAPTDELTINNGAIRVTPVGEDNTLFVYTVRKQYRTYPSFLVNNVLLGHQPDLVATLAERMKEVAKEQ